jgi:methionyl-tRNA formyltransferase
MTLTFAFLCLKEHPYAREMLRQLMSIGHVPSVIVEETSKIADEEREKFLLRIQGFDVAPTISEQIAGFPQVSRVEVSNHNNEASENAIRAAAPELIVLGGTRIIKPNIIRLANVFYAISSTH